MKALPANPLSPRLGWYHPSHDGARVVLLLVFGNSFGG
jgi:hypothetical protein